MHISDDLNLQNIFKKYFKIIRLAIIQGKRIKFTLLFNA